MIGNKIPVKILSVQLIANVSPTLRKELGIDNRFKSLGIISTDCDDVTYMALDEATKVSAVEVVYGRSLYAGAANASTKLAGEVIGILGGPSPSEVTSGLEGALNFIHSGVGFEPANPDGDVVFLAHCISRTGAYLSSMAKVGQGEAVAYLVAPPVEAIYGLDAAMKASDVELRCFFEPPTETNFGGGLLTGTQSACVSACEAFAQAVRDVANQPLNFGGGHGI